MLTRWRTEITRWLRQQPRRYRYLAAGVLLAMGAPAGYFVVRCWQEGLLPHPRWLYAEITGDLTTYAYLLVSTAVVFGALGWRLGKREDALRQQSQTDALTGLLNRRAFDTTLSAEITRALRYRQPLSLLMIDVDHLKQINDAHGHAGGDRALIAVAHAIRAVTRATDQAARLGGDEFGIIAPSTGADDAADLAGRLRAVVAESLANTYPTAEALLSVSIGVSDLSTASNPSALMEAADGALYEAKAAGRNRVVVARRDARDALSP